MTDKERTEVREMIHGVLSGWQAGTIAREEVTNIHLKNINDHLGRINGSIAEHKKILSEHEIIIAENLPHKKVNCVQADVIQELHDNMISEKTIKKTIYVAIGIISTIIAIILGINQILFSPKTEIDRLKKQVDMINVPVETRGGIVLYPSGMLNDSLENEIVQH